MDDLISRQAAIDAICKEWCGVAHKDCRCPFDPTVDDGYWCDGCESALITLPQLPSAEPEPAIPLQWIETQIEWLKSLDNAFSTLTAGQISAMVNKWKGEQDG